MLFCNGTQGRRSASGQVFQEMEVFFLREMEVLVSNLQGFTFSFVRNEANNSAHLGARHALRLYVSIASYELIPGFLVEFFSTRTIIVFQIKCFGRRKGCWCSNFKFFILLKCD